jgi:hypothetical protein
VKKVTLIVPDEIQHVIGSSRSRTVESENLSTVNIIAALCDRDDYHQYFYFESPDGVKVVSIVDYEEQRSVERKTGTPAPDDRR